MTPTIFPSQQPADQTAYVYTRVTTTYTQHSDAASDDGSDCDDVFDSPEARGRRAMQALVDHSVPLAAAARSQAPTHGTARADREAFNLVHLVHPNIPVQRIWHLSESVQELCKIYHTTPQSVIETLIALRDIHRTGNQSQVFNGHVRERALSVAMDLCNTASDKPRKQLVWEARGMPWTRLVDFTGDVALTALGTTAITGTTAAATYMAASCAAAQLAAFKGAATTGAMAKACALGSVAAVGTGALTVVTSGAAAVSVAWWVGTIKAYRDVWDNDFARDAWLFHKMQVHNVLPGGPRLGTVCDHYNGDWTSPIADMGGWLKGCPKT